MAFYQQSSLSFGDAKALVAESGNKDGSAMLLRAGRAIQAAMRHWDTKANWPWLVQLADDPAGEHFGFDPDVVSGTSTYALPYNFKDVYTLRFDNRTLESAERRKYDRLFWEQSGGHVVAYNLLYAGDVGKVELMHTPNSSGELELKYYRHIRIPCSTTALLNTGSISSGGNTVLTYGSLSGAQIQNNLLVYTSAGALNTSAFTSSTPFVVSISDVADIATPSVLNSAVVSLPADASVSTGYVQIGSDNTALDIPYKYEDYVLAWARHKFLADLGAPESRINYHLRYAEAGLEAAVAEMNTMPEDMDLAIEPQISGADYATELIWLR